MGVAIEKKLTRQPIQTDYLESLIRGDVNDCKCACDIPGALAKGFKHSSQKCPRYLAGRELAVIMERIRKAEQEITLRNALRLLRG